VAWSRYDLVNFRFVIQKVPTFGDVLTVFLALLLFEILPLLDDFHRVEVFAVDVVAFDAAAVSACLKIVDLLNAQLLHPLSIILYD
jgi:hypothetical protein